MPNKAESSADGKTINLMKQANRGLLIRIRVLEALTAKYEARLESYKNALELALKGIDVLSKKEKK